MTSTNQWNSARIISMRASFPRRAARARRHAGRRLGLAPLQQFERGVHAGILVCQRLAHAWVVEIEGNTVAVLEVVVRIDAMALDGAARWREVTRGGEFDGAALREWHHGLHGTFAEG